jgi:hypothetical protein
MLYIKSLFTFQQSDPSYPHLCCAHLLFKYLKKIKKKFIVM